MLVSETKTERMLGIKEASELLGLSTKTLYSWVYRKRIPYVKVGTLVKFKPSVIDRYIRDHTIDAAESI